MKILLVRHGQSGADIENKCEGNYDSPLTDKGKNQAKKLSKWLEKNHSEIDKIYTSPLQRALETANIISTLISKELMIDNRLSELNIGIWAGLPKEEAFKKFPFPKDGFKHFQRVPNGESAIELRARAEDFFHEITNSIDSECILIVSHGNLINMLYRTFLNIPLDSNIMFNCAQSNVHCWNYTDKKRQVIYSNKECNLE